MMTKNSKTATQKSQFLTNEEIGERMKDLRTYSDLEGFLKELVAPALQGMLEAEMEQHLGYPKNHASGYGTGNSRNGHRPRKLKTTAGEVAISIPRDRNGDYEPTAVKNYESRPGAFDDQIITLYAKGNSTREIADFAQEIYGVNVSADMISSITDKVLPAVEEWQNRPLQKIYPIVFLDGIHFKVREGGKIVSKCAYIMLGINENGYKEILGIWIGENESAKFWMGTLNEIRNRGVEDIFIACIDGLTGFKDAIQAVFPMTEIQRCIVHQIRNTTKFLPHKDKKKFCQDLKQIYTAPTEEAGLQGLEFVKEKWPQYKEYLKSWERDWTDLSTFYIYPEAIRKTIYTTNAVENLNRQLRKVTKTKGVFPHDQALKKLLWLAQKDITKKWTNAVRDWAQIAAQFSIIFEGRFNL